MAECFSQPKLPDASTWPLTGMGTDPERKMHQISTLTPESETKPSIEQTKARKRGRARSSKKFQCPVEKCGKIYSRAEHLHRHQLNHKPKQIYRCQVLNCDRTFVREDLLYRHQNRHGNEDSLSPRNNVSMTNSQRYIDSLKSTTESSAGPNSPLQIAIESLVSMSSTPTLLPESINQDPSHQAPILSTQLDRRDDPFQTIQPPDSVQIAPTVAAATMAFPFGTSNDQMDMASNFPYQSTGPSRFDDSRGSWQDEEITPYEISMFGGQSYDRSPFAIPDDFIQYLNLFDDSSSTMSPNFNIDEYSNYVTKQPSYDLITASAKIAENNLMPENFMGGYSGFEADLPSKILSEEKSNEIFNLVRERFSRAGNIMTENEDSLFSSDSFQPFNVLSTEMMETYIDNFWRIFHPQLPILHKPTFSPDTTPNLLLIAIIIIGASCPSKRNGHTVDQYSSKLSAALAWDLRWEIFRDAHFRSADLWVFQALVLLEVYEKMFSTRAMHERAHIHHATTITLMRRGGSLTGRSPLDSPPSFEDNSNGSESLKAYQTNKWWENWINREATRRVAFAALVVDATHAAMFGHSAVMVTHEIRCLLPCDEALWSATSASEVGRIESTLRANGVKPQSFLEGLQKTLNGQELHTNAFGRSILMSGLLSVSWYMNQRDLQVKSLGVDSVARLKGAKWRKSITRAFDFWKQSYERAAENASVNVPGQYMEQELVIENRTALYHLAHMSMHVSIVECQVFAGANRVLGRIIGKQDFNSARRRIRNVWAPTSDARTAVFFAIRYLCIALLPKTDRSDGMESILEPHARKSLFPSRCWVLYSAALVVWCYSYAVDGPTTVASTGHSLNDQVRDMKTFLLRVENIRSPDDVVHFRLNSCTSLLKVLCCIFRKAEWELLHEGADLLTNCIKLIGGV